MIIKTHYLPQLVWLCNTYQATYHLGMQQGHWYEFVFNFRWRLFLLIICIICCLLNLNNHEISVIYKQKNEFQRSKYLEATKAFQFLFSSISSNIYFLILLLCVPINPCELISQWVPQLLIMMWHKLEDDVIGQWNLEGVPCCMPLTSQHRDKEKPPRTRSQVVTKFTSSLVCCW